ncbi:MAG: Nif11 family protein [Synechococcaceae bacterium WB4_2_0805]|nr:Nif11 family protein [Synechococcaceae bacterium WB4_2_0805]
MSEEQLKSFWKLVENDTNLREKIKSSTQLKAVWLHDGDVDTQKEADAVVAIAKEAGFTITVEEALESF